MRENTYYFFKQIGDTASWKDEHISTKHCTALEAQKTADEYNKNNDGYFYFMEMEEVKKEQGNPAYIPVSIYK